MARAVWPERGIKIIVSASSAGAADITARLIAHSMQESLGMPIVIKKSAVRSD
jgi:tripartite-type tricarboxylate transporter receptor subunit TctC